MEASWETELAELIRIPSVSADPIHAADVRRAAEWVRDFISRSGGSAEITPVGEREIVVGEIPASNGGGGAPTILCYGHYDVQPPAPLELWESDPYELVERDGWVYARGITDDKGQLYVLLKAAELLARDGALPVNLRFACDGEEEIGGTTIVDFLAQDERGADGCIIFDGGMLRQDVPIFDLATRGLVAFDVKVTTGARDLHSGMYGGAALNAVHVLMRCLQSVLARENWLLPDELRVGIVPPTEEELAAWGALPPGGDEMRVQGARALDPQAEEQFYVRTWAEPSADVNGIIGGKPGLRNTTLSVHASAEFTVRLAPGQDVETIGAAAERLVRAAAPPGAEVDVQWAGTGPGRVDPASPLVQLGLDAFERALGVRPLLCRSGGTLPIMPALEQKGIPTILTGFGTPESAVHSPNERMRADYFEKGVATAQALYTELAKLP
jgi:acetylornithine deacetylase/succinyl-diaminopimelate desuccinylase-like protein